MKSSYTVRFTPEAADDLERFYAFILERENTDWLVAEKALEAIDYSLEQLSSFPYNCRKVKANNPYLREIIIPFGNTGYVALFEIEPDDIVTILAVRHQREEDYN